MNIVYFALDAGVAPSDWKQHAGELWPDVVSAIKFHTRFGDFLLARDAYATAAFGTKAERRRSNTMSAVADAIAQEIAESPAVAPLLAAGFKQITERLEALRNTPRHEYRSGDPYTKGNPSNDFSW